MTSPLWRRYTAGAARPRLLLFLISSALSACLVTFLHPSSLAFAQVDGVVRVLIADHLKLVQITATELVVSDEQGHRVGQFQRSRPLTLTVGRAGLMMGEFELGTSVVQVRPSGTSATLVGFGSYRGMLRVLVRDGQLSVVNVLPLEQYLPGLLAGEMPPSWPAEALKAQAVMARTYARAKVMASSSLPWDLTSTHMDQVYHGSSVEQVSTLRAVRATLGQVLRRGGKLVQAYYHSTCGGRTETPASVWPGGGDYPPSVACRWCRASPHQLWRVAIGSTQMAAKLRPRGFTSPEILKVWGQDLSPGDRWTSVVARGAAGDITVGGNMFRQMMGFDVVKSLKFSVVVSGGQVEFEGAGFGHGVGMCQWGARGQALEGRHFKEILSTYFPASEVGQ